jgi:hypothetical protein
MLGSVIALLIMLILTVLAMYNFIQHEPDINAGASALPCQLTTL